VQRRYYLKKYKKNFEIVTEKLKAVEEKDRIRNFQPPVSGELVMTTFGLAPCNEVGVIKSRIKEAILEGEIPNESKEAIEYMLQLGKELGLSVVLAPSFAE
jgi:poly(A) polymerase